MLLFVVVRSFRCQDVLKLLAMEILFQEINILPRIKRLETATSEEFYTVAILGQKLRETCQR